MNTKRFIKLQIIIVMLLLLALISNTYAWSTRPAVYGGAFMSENNTDGDSSLTCDNNLSNFTAMSFDTRAHDYYINGDGCTAVTYEGTANDDGTITYDETTDITNKAYTRITSGMVLYFKTVITNSKAIDTNTSLFVDISYASKLNSKINIGVSAPTKSIISNISSSTLSNRWIPIVSQYEISANGSATIEWYITFKYSGTFTITNIVLTNN